jgi:poly [ADP-ribose] polymerase 10/14/15
MEDRPPLGVDGISTQAGWFPLGHTAHPRQEQLEALQEKMGGIGASDALKAPATWGSVKDPLVAQLFPLPDGPEKSSVARAFLREAEMVNAGIQVVSVERVQNMSMWQSYAVKRQTVVQREKDTPAEASRFERVWLFHGTDAETMEKIIQQGFNRSFCGKNAVAFGKGVYFARDASYSSHPKYSVPNKQGVQHMFLCRVVVGEYCKGQNGGLTPDVRKGHMLCAARSNPAATLCRIAAACAGAVAGTTRRSTGR